MNYQIVLCWCSLQVDVKIRPGTHASEHAGLSRMHKHVALKPFVSSTTLVATLTPTLALSHLHCIVWLCSAVYLHVHMHVVVVQWSLS